MVERAGRIIAFVAGLLLFWSPAQTDTHAAKPDSVVVKDVEGRSVRPLAGKARKATLLFFIAHDCPISNGYAPEMARICKAYEARGVTTYVVYVERDIKPADARKHA